jgi:hypothetical protein
VSTATGAAVALAWGRCGAYPTPHHHVKVGFIPERKLDHLASIAEDMFIVGRWVLDRRVGLGWGCYLGGGAVVERSTVGSTVGSLLLPSLSVFHHSNTHIVTYGVAAGTAHSTTVTSTMSAATTTTCMTTSGISTASGRRSGVTAGATEIDHVVSGGLGHRR